MGQESDGHEVGVPRSHQNTELIKKVTTFDDCWVLQMLSNTIVFKSNTKVTLTPKLEHTRTLNIR